MTQTIKIEFEDNGVIDALNRLVAAGSNLTPAMRAIVEVLRHNTMQNFADQSGPSGKWEPFKNPPKRKTRTNPKLLRDTGRLANSITPAFSADSAQIGTNVIYAAIHQFGGDIRRDPFAGSVRLRTDRKGNLLKRGNLATFAKKDHKQAVTRTFNSAGFTIAMPARPYLPFIGNRLQDSVEAQILQTLRRFLAGAKS